MIKVSKRYIHGIVVKTLLFCTNCLRFTMGGGILFCLFLHASCFLYAEESSLLSPAEQLEVLEKALSVSQKNQEILAKNSQAIAEKQEELKRKKIELAAEIQSRERRISEQEKKHLALEVLKTALEKDILQKTEEFLKLLGGIETLEITKIPPFLEETNALRLMRGHILFADLLESVQRKSLALSQALSQLKEGKKRLEEVRKTLAQEMQTLTEKRRMLEVLFVDHKRQKEENDEHFKKEQEAHQKLVEKAKTLRELLDHLAKKAQEQDEQKKTLKNNPRLFSAHTFEDARGLLPNPVEGEKVRRFSEADGFGGKVKGTFFAARAQGTVVAPFGGEVIFAAPFRGYGKVLILDVGQGYAMLLCGLGEVMVKSGQTIEAGEPVGEMPKAEDSLRLLGDWQAQAKRLLYVEFRKNGNVVDPSPWWKGR